MAAIVGLFDGVRVLLRSSTKAENKGRLLVLIWSGRVYLMLVTITPDLKVWRYAHSIILVNANGASVKAAQENPGKAVIEFPPRKFKPKVLLKAAQFISGLKSVDIRCF